MPNKWQEDLKKLKEKYSLIQAMQKSVLEAETAFNKDFEEFMSTVGFRKGDKFHLIDLIEKASELKS